MNSSGRTVPVGADEFSRRLVKLCLDSGGGGLPRRARDRGIVLKAATLGFEAGRTYTEREVNGVLAAWLRDVGAALESDHVSIRRELVDEGFMERDSGGAWYRLGPAARARTRFAPEIDAIAPERLIRDARAARAARRIAQGAESRP